MVDRGAAVQWCSQYPAEEEILFAPLTGLEVTGEPVVEKQTIVIKLRLNVNLHDMTIEEVTAKMRKTHKELTRTIKTDLVALDFPSKCLGPLDDHELKYKDKDGEWFVAAENYKQATNDILQTKLEVCALVLQSDSATESNQQKAAGILFNPSDAGAMAIGVKTLLLDETGTLLQQHSSRLSGGLSRLDLQGLNITVELPDEIIQLLGSAEYFNLSGNKFSNVEEGTALATMIYGMTNWKDVKELPWQGRKEWKELPTFIQYFASVTSINLEGCEALEGEIVAIRCLSTHFTI